MRIILTEQGQVLRKSMAIEQKAQKIAANTQKFDESYYKMQAPAPTQNGWKKNTS